MLVSFMKYIFYVAVNEYSKQLNHAKCEVKCVLCYQTTFCFFDYDDTTILRFKMLSIFNNILFL